jgi:DNA-binding response OmpR family regulator
MPVKQQPSILIVEDEPGIVDFLEMGLRAEGFEVRSEDDGLRGLQAFERLRPSLVILDVMLPGLDGMSVCRRIRSQSRVPIIMLTVKSEVEHRVEGLTAGADDYLSKPFRFEELLARVRAVLRRSDDGSSADELSFGDLHLSTASREVVRGGRAIQLTSREFDLLAFLMRRPLQILSKEVILQQVWGYDSYGDTNIVEVYVRYLRQKLGDAPLIQTVRGAGYVLREAAAGRDSGG